MPRFPYPPDVPTDLRDLFKLNRQDRTSRDLGASSITRGEGSMDLYETDDGPVVGRYGDLPDGSFGVGFTHRGAFWNVSDLIGQGQDHDDAQDGRLNGHDGRLDGHATRLGAAEGRLDGAEGRLDSHATRIGSAEGRLDAHAGRLGGAEGRLDDHAGRIGATETRNSTQDGRLDNHASRIGAVESVNGTQNGRLDSHAQRVGAVEGQAQTLETLYEELSARYDDLRAKTESLAAWRGNLVNMSQRLRAIDGGPEFEFPYIG